MADRMAARIFIGGKIPEILVEPLCDQIDASSASIEYGDPPLRPQTAQDLLDVREQRNKNDSNCPSLLVLYDDEASWGEFQELEEFLREHEIAYTRHSDGKYEHDPCIVEYRPGHDLVELAANKSMEPVVPAGEVQKALDKLDEAIKHDHHGRTGAAEAVMMKARRMLRKLLPPELPPLESFEIDSIKNKEPESG
ncbi:MAG TPA: hypothetical protein DD670_13460 [Planctomycetaceae bacterium]|nr:hypothetical protein [Planctomycetaceae bacterium]